MTDFIKTIGKWMIDIDGQMEADPELRAGVAGLILLVFTLVVVFLAWKAPKGEENDLP